MLNIRELWKRVVRKFKFKFRGLELVKFISRFVEIIPIIINIRITILGLKYRVKIINSNFKRVRNKIYKFIKWLKTDYHIKRRTHLKIIRKRSIY